MIRPCTWCETEHEAGVDGFCSGDCHEKFNTACLLWGKEQYGTGEVSIWQLQRRLGRHARRTQRDPASEGAQMAPIPKYALWAQGEPVERNGMCEESKWS